MTLKLIPLLALGVLIVGCKSGDNGATTTTTPDSTAATTGSTVDNTPKSSASATSSTDNAPVTDSGTGIAPFVGKWTSDEKSMAGVTTEIKDDGSLTMTGPAPMPDVPKGSTMEMAATLKIDGDKGTMHLVSAKITAPDDADAKGKATVDKDNAETQKAAAAQKDETGTIKWNGKDSFVETDDASKKVTTYTRAS